MADSRSRRRTEISSSDDISDSDESSSGEEIDIKMSASAPDEKVKDLVCEFCEKSFKSHKSYLMHKRTTHKTKAFSCVLCKSSFSLRGSLMHHMKSFHPECGRHPCEYPSCEKSFNSIKEKNFHHKKHWRYMCKHCKKRYLARDTMLSHVASCH